MKTAMFRVAALLALLGVPLSAQDAPSPPPEAMPTYDVNQIVLEYVPLPNGVNDDALTSVTRLFRRLVLVRNADGSVRGPISNMDCTDDGVFVYDTPVYVKVVRDALGKAEAGVSRSPEAELLTEIYAPRFVAVERLYGALEPLRRKVLEAGAPGMPPEDHDNVVSQKSPPLLVLRDTEEHVARMRELLERLDQPPPQALLTCWVVRARGTETDPGIPAELADNLRRLLPYRGFQLLTTVVVRTSVLAGEEPSLSGSWHREQEDGSADSGVFTLKLRPNGLDQEARRISLDRIEFQSEDGPRFDTSAVLDFDEYTVLGAAGSEPLLVTLQIKSLVK
jgi:hypothetical protein